MSRSVGFERTSSGNSHDGQWRNCEDYIGTYASRRYLTDESARLRISEFGYTQRVVSIEGTICWKNLTRLQPADEGTSSIFKLQHLQGHREHVLVCSCAKHDGSQ